jgi:hypothetical protein
MPIAIMNCPQEARGPKLASKEPWARGPGTGFSCTESSGDSSEEDELGRMRLWGAKSRMCLTFIETLHSSQIFFISPSKV